MTPTRNGLAALTITLALTGSTLAQDSARVIDRDGLQLELSSRRVLVARPVERLQRVQGQGAQRWVWSRNGNSVPLVDRKKQWTDEEARAVASALDRLPDVFIRKAIAGGMKRIYRDGAQPEAPTDYLETAPDTRAGVAVPPAPWNFVAMGDNLFESPERTYKTVTHELGHCVQWSISGWATPLTGTPGWTGISWTTGIPKVGMKSWNGFVSSYARTNHLEDFAETCAYYWLEPDALREANPTKFRFMRDVVFEGLVSPESARQDCRACPDHVEPQITSLGDTRDDIFALVKVRGEHFMGPLDGGFNRVRYRSTTAVHLPVSRTTVWSWVPGIATGSAPITVTTQDGTSNQAAFTVTKPWWKFW